MFTLIAIAIGAILGYLAVRLILFILEVLIDLFNLLF